MYRNTNYGIKRLLQSDAGIHLTNNEFKDAMLACDFKPVDPNALIGHIASAKGRRLLRKNDANI